MVDLKIELPKGFLDEEVRCNYTITKQMKEVWAVELDMLMEFQRVCNKYHLTYFADSGTLIGAIRDGGFIPWDDDIDLVMLREDYTKLISIANEEFRHPYFLQCTYTEEEPYLRAHAQLRNSDTTGCISHDRNKNINRGIFIDIFPMDVIPDPDSLKFKCHKNRIINYWKFLRNIEYDAATASFKRKLFHFVAGFTVNKDNFKTKFQKYERICSKYNSLPYEYVSYIAYSKGKKKHLWKKAWFDGTKTIPFEFTEICIPVGYDERLTTEYGDYMRPTKAPTTHGNVLFDTNKSYKEVLGNE